MLLAFSILPIAVLVVDLAVLGDKAWRAALFSAVTAVATALLFFREGLPPSALPGVAAGGAEFALRSICLVVLAALFTYAVAVESGAMDVIRRGLAAVSDDRRVLALLIVWGFGNFMEGMAGFGTAVAIPAAILVGVGFDPVKAVLTCLVANTTPTAFGSVGIPVLTLARESGCDPSSLSATTALLQLSVTAAGPFLILAVLDGWRGLKGMGAYLLAVDIAFLVPWTLTAAFVGCELPDILGGLSAMAAIGLLAMRGRRFGGIGAQARAWAPFGFVVLFIGGASFLPHAAKAYVNVGILVLCAGFCGGLVQGLSVLRMLRILLATARRYAAALSTIALVLVLARVMGRAGMIATLADALVAATGAAYPFAATAVGALGGFVTGSGTNSCVLFGALQAKAAVAVGASPELLAAANVMGAGIGKMICPQSIAIGVAAAGISGASGGIMRKMTPWFVGILLAASAVCGLSYNY